MRLKLIPYFNSTLLPATPDHEWERRAAKRIFEGTYEDGDTLVRSELDFDSSSLPIEIQLDTVFRLMNADYRPNGPRERSLSVGDMVAALSEPGDVPFAADLLIGVWRCTPDGWVLAFPIPMPIAVDLVTGAVGS